jgi:hypothetical protein
MLKQHKNNVEREEYNNWQMKKKVIPYNSS